MRGRVFILAALLTAAAGMGRAVDWPQWAGPSRNGVSPATGVFKEGPFELREVWRRPVAAGVSALAVSGDRIFSLGSEEGKDYVFALDAGTGKELWRAPLGASLTTMDFGVASTPATDGQRVFVLGAECRLLALEATNGAVVWQRDLKAQDNTGPMPRGCWTSPLLEGDLLIVQVNGDPDKRVMAFDKVSGAVVWSSAGVEKSMRSSPLVADIGGVRQVVVHDVTKDVKGGLYGLRLKDGALLWSVRFPETGSYSYDTPVLLADGRVGVVAWSDFRTAAVHRQGESFAAEPGWSAREIRAEVQPYNLHAVALGEHVYGFGGELLVCLDAATGKTVWKEKTYPGSLLAVDGHLVAISQAAGILRVIEATPAGYREKGRLEVFTPGASTDTPPSFAGRRIYLRNSEEIVVLEVVKAAK
ncbi:MAG TPA: PQQ-binding-like beta-propeller repeat protein [Thermoanaerobaculia bacterium]|nr:PQQ-binding-like beta-propeller repeat protein [Thermoanaerobaculia bacterium]